MAYILKNNQMGQFYDTQNINSSHTYSTSNRSELY